MIVVGGTYVERSAQPYLHRVAGSGLRAALIADGLADEVRLVTAIADNEDGVLATVNAYDLDTELRRRTEAVEFSYFTPVDRPVIIGRDAGLLDDAVVEGDDILAFGMVERRPPVKARTVVVDPQQPVGLAGDPFEGVTAERRALVANAAEACALTSIDDAGAAASALVSDTGCAVVVVKDGARGAHVAIGERTTIVPPCWSEHVAPLGTGDCFAAVFAARWLAGADSVEAARDASACTAQYAADGDVAPPRFDPDAADPVPVNDARVYLAAPFFTLGERWLVELCRNHLSPHVFSPLHDVGPGDLEVAQADIDGLRDCDAVFAVVDGNDPGTLFEVGWAVSQGIPVVAYAARPDLEGAKMLTGLGGELCEDLSTGLYRAVWHAMARRASRE